MTFLSILMRYVVAFAEVTVVGAIFKARGIFKPLLMFCGGFGSNVPFLTVTGLNPYQIVRWLWKFFLVVHPEFSFLITTKTPRKGKLGFPGFPLRSLLRYAVSVNTVVSCTTRPLLRSRRPRYQKHQRRIPSTSASSEHR